MDQYDDQFFSLKGMKALVTGAGKGIGRSIVESLVSLGAEVAIHYHTSEAQAEDLAQKINSRSGTAWTVKADVTQGSDVNTMLEKVKNEWGCLDILVNNAGDIIKKNLIETMPDELAEEVVRLNLTSVVYVTRAAIPLLRNGHMPSIINIGSVAAHIGPGGGAALYAATKGAIHTLTRGLARELGPDIRVNGVAPGVIMTDFHRKHSTEAELRSVAEGALLKRIGQPGDIGPAVAFLCSKGAAYITGEILEVNGGRWVA